MSGSSGWSGWRILDVGSGGDPLPQATHLADVSVEGDDQRLGQRLTLDGRPFVLCSVEDLPFADGAFDFSFCRHVLEHVDDPHRACSELSRVSRRGYVECPASWLEVAAPSAEHRWMVDVEDGELIFREKLPNERIDLFGLGAHIFSLVRAPGFRRLWGDRSVLSLRNAVYTWEGEIRARIVPRSRRRQPRPAAWVRRHPTLARWIAEHVRGRSDA